MIKNEVWLSSAVKELSVAGLATARLDSLVLLEDVTGKNRSWLLANPKFELSEKQKKRLDNLIIQRVRHEPLAYIRKKTEFYGREFYIDNRVLEPRPETETMIDMTKKILGHRSGLSIVDVGTGSGAIAITMKLEAPLVNITATDIDDNCLKVAKKNAKKLKANVNLLQCDLLQILDHKTRPLTSTNIFAILANLPYVPNNFQINPAAMHEPKLAIYGGKDGLNIYRNLFKQVGILPRKPKFIITESLPPQHDKLADIAKKAQFKLITTEDFIQLFEL